METEIWKQFRNALWESNTFFTPAPILFQLCVPCVHEKKRITKKLNYLKRKITRSWNLKLKKIQWREMLRSCVPWNCLGENVKAMERNVFLRRLSFISFPVNEANKKKYWMCSTWSNLSRTVLNSFIWLFPIQLKQAAKIWQRYNGNITQRSSKETVQIWLYHSIFTWDLNKISCYFPVSQHFEYFSHFFCYEKKRWKRFWWAP